MNITKVTFKDFRNLGCANLAPDNANGLSNDLKLNGGGLIVLLGANNEGKSNVLEGLRKLGRFYENNALDTEDKPNFVRYESGLPEIVAHLEDTLEQEHDDFADKTYNITFTKGVIEKGLENHSEIRDEATYKEFLQKLLESGKSIVYGKDQDGIRDEIKIFIPEHNFTLCCSATNGGKSLQCFSILEKKSCESIKDFDKAMALRCGFVINGSKGADDASELREYLKNPKQPNIQKHTLTISLEKGIIPSENLSPIIERTSFNEQVTRIVEWGKNLDFTMAKLENNAWSRIGWVGDELAIQYKRDIDSLESKLSSSDYKTMLDVYQRFYTFFYGESFQELLGKVKRYYSQELQKMNVDIDLQLPSSKELESYIEFNENFPRIYYYKQRELKDSDLEVKPDNFENSAFFKALFAILGPGYSEKVKKAYEHQSSQDSYLDPTEGLINEHIKEKINTRFNEMYCLDQDTYSFKIKLSETKISFIMSKNTEPLELSKQSVGFRKFFALFFNFLYQTKHNKGDIVLIDEAESHLSVPAQKDFRKFLKDFGQNQGITFIIATHSPYMLDSDYLDEIRIVKNLSTQDTDSKDTDSQSHKGAAIINDFSVISEEGADTLREIRKALGTNFAPEDRIIFVEGISDYNYLTAFKNLYEQEKDTKINLAFLPIAGVGKGENGEGFSETQRQKCKAIIAFAKTCKIANPTLLVDNDKAGQTMKEGAEKEFKKELSVLNLADYVCGAKEKKDGSKDIKDIESLFSNEDRAMFGIFTSGEIEKHKEQNTYQRDTMSKNIVSRRIKYKLIKEENKVSEATKGNFFTLLESLKKYEDSDNPNS